MKKLILLILLIINGYYLNAQYGWVGNVVYHTDFGYEPINNEQHKFTFTTFFTFGDPGGCPNGVEIIEIENDTLFVKAFYDIRGDWNQMGCESYNEFYFNQNIPSNITTIKMSTNVIVNEVGNPEGTYTVEDLYTHIIDLEDMSTSDTGLLDKISLYPNPAKESFSILSSLNIVRIEIYNQTGQLVQSSKNVNNSFDVSRLGNGVYVVKLYDENNRSVVKKLVVKK